MAALILETNPSLVVEIGTFMGQILLPQAFALRHNSHIWQEAHGIIVGIDPYEIESATEGSNDKENDEWWKSINLEDVHAKTQKLIRQDHHLEKWAILIRARSQDIDRVLGYIDILYIDGNHSEESSVRDVMNYVPKVRDEGYIWMDDCEWPTMQHALKVINSYCN